MAFAGDSMAPGAQGTITGSFCVFSEPVTLATYSLLRIKTEDGYQSLPMCGPDRAPKMPTPSTSDTESDDYSDGDGFTNGFQLPPNVQIDDAILGPNDAVVLFGDGGWWPKDERWGIGVISRTTGQSWACGGKIDIPYAVDCGNNKVDCAVIEALAVRKMLDIGTLRGCKARQSKEIAAPQNQAGTSWDTFGKHLVVVTDRTALIGNIRTMCRDHKIKKPKCVPSKYKSAFQSMVESVVVSIANACSVYERVSIVHKSKFETESTWSRHDWPPHMLACAGAYIKAVPLTVQMASREDMDIKIRSIQLRGSMYEHATFSYDWDK